MDNKPQSTSKNAGYIISLVVAVLLFLLSVLPDANSAHNRGVKYSKAGDYDKAIVEYTEAIRLNSKKPWPYFNRAPGLRT